jgi:alanine racemase
MRTTRQDILSAVHGNLLKTVPLTDTVGHILLDSRQVIYPESSVFFALPGIRYDGHDFIKKVYDTGVRCFVVSQKINPDDFPDTCFILVPDVLTALQSLATWHRHRFSIPVIGITGSNGKTIVKEWLFQLLREDYYIARSPGSYNSQTGVPLSVWEIQQEHTLGIFEAGISKPGEMECIAPVIDCATGIFTMLGEAHSEGFASNAEKLREKLLLFRKSNILIYCADDPEVDRGIREAFAHDGKTPVPRLFAWSTRQEADLSVITIQSSRNQTKITAVYGEKIISIEIPFTDKASISNAIHCWSLLSLYGYQQEVIAERMSKLEPVAMRLELKAGINQCTVINDSYNSDLTSLKIAMDFAAQHSHGLRRTLILSDILQSGKAPQKLYREVAHFLKEKQFARFIGIGEEVQLLKELLPANLAVAFYPDTDTFLQQLRSVDFRDEIILVKGARRYGFEQIAERLALKAHKTVLEINLNALVHNFHVYKSLLRPGVKIMAMVKASAYGNGSFEVARLLEYQGAHYLAVAYADEGIALRNGGVRLPILVLNPEEGSFDPIMRFDLEPEIYSLPLLGQFIEFARGVESVFIHLKLDTGMHRLGFQEGDLESVIRQLRSHPQIRVRTVFSHLAASESPDHDAFTHEQATRFATMYEIIAAGLGYRPLRHILNSGGITRFPEYQLDMVRLGIGLYGIDSSEVLQHQLQTVQTLKATISQIKKIPAGETVGYGRRGVADKEISIATISIGYADGLRRSAGNGHYSVLIRGQRAPTIGSVCMDMTMIDITEITGAAEGDEVILFGDMPSARELAQCYGTIPYEVFTGISERVKRVYFQERM